MILILLKYGRAFALPKAFRWDMDHPVALHRENKLLFPSTHWQAYFQS